MLASAETPLQEDKIPPHERPPAGMPSVADGDMNRSMASVMSPPRGTKQSSRNTFQDLAGDDGHKGRSGGGDSPGRNKVAEFDGIGFPRDDDSGGSNKGGRKHDDRERDKGRDKDRQRDRDRDIDRDRDDHRRSSRDPYDDHDQRDRRDRRRGDSGADDDDRGSHRGGSRGRGGGGGWGGDDYDDEFRSDGRGRRGDRGDDDRDHRRRSDSHGGYGSEPSGSGAVVPFGGGTSAGLPPPELLGGGGRHDLNDLLQEEERRLKEELDKRRADLGAAPYEGGGMEMAMQEPPPGSIADMQRQINALVTELALKERQLREVAVDDLARCLLDAQQAARDLRVALATKDDELARIKLQLKQLNSGNADSWDKIVADASAECIRLRREVDEWKARDLEAARRWSEQQEQLAAYAARIAELETLLGRQRDAAEEDAVARDTEIRAMNKRMQEVSV